MNVVELSVTDDEYGLILRVMSSGGNNLRFDLTHEQLHRLAVQSTKTFQRREGSRPVRVRWKDGSVFVYNDPGLRLRVGSEVLVPAPFYKLDHVPLRGRVVALGRDGYTGPIRDVLQRAP